ncbi:MAG: ABC transporter substrate-binding protein [Lachnospiraceae bacterium]|nr:ABC transporter substrate-binding protein [Lachnospiraceae bacterium]
MKKKVLAVILTLCMGASLFGCGSKETASDAGKEENSEVSADAEDEENAEAGEEEGAEVTYKIGISQFAEHGSLDNCREGFLEGLKEAGIEEGKNLEVMYDNAQADTGTASTIADDYVSKNVDLICAIATPTAMAAYNSTMDTDIPVIYTAVSDPVASQLANEDGTSVGNITGTSDKLPVTEQLEMIREILPDAKKIGILYTTSETNSESTIAEYKEHAAEYGFEIVESGINTIADVPLAAADLASKVDCINNLTDNTVVSALQTVLKAANDAGIPVFGSEIEQVKSGCLAAMGLDYLELGKQTGAMAAKVLKGEAKAEELNFETITEASLYINTAAADKIGMTLDQAFVDGASEVFEEIVAE